MKIISTQRKTFLNIAFILVGAGIIFFLMRAPEETTAKLPKDDLHTEFHNIQSKKEAEKNCTECHSLEGSSPLSETHPPKYRCLFCHKRD